MKKPKTLPILPPWTVHLRDVPPAGVHVRKGEQDAAFLAALAAHLGVEAARGFALDVEVKPMAGDGLIVKGEARATVVQPCSVTLEPVESRLAAPIALSFLPERAMPEPVEGDADDPMADIDPPDLLIDDAVDLAAIAAEFLLLEVNPYPRKQGASFGVQGDGEVQSPFAALKDLKAEKEHKE